MDFEKIQMWWYSKCKPGIKSFFSRVYEGLLYSVNRIDLPTEAEEQIKIKEKECQEKVDDLATHYQKKIRGIEEDFEQECSKLEKTIAELQEESTEKGEVLDEYIRRYTELYKEHLNLFLKEAGLDIKNKPYFGCLIKYHHGQLSLLQLNRRAIYSLQKADYTERDFVEQYGSTLEKALKERPKQTILSLSFPPEDRTQFQLTYLGENHVLLDSDFDLLPLHYRLELLYSPQPQSQ